MWGQRNSKYTTAVGVQLLSKIHCLELQLRDVSRLQNHLVDRCNERIDFIGDATDCVGSVVDKLNDRINLQDIQIEQLANMVNDLVGKTQAQEKEIKNLKSDRESHHKVINTMTAKVIALEQCVEDIQKVFPQVGGTWPSLIIADLFLL
jgi:chromosome segregation ATPase